MYSISVIATVTLRPQQTTVRVGIGAMGIDVTDVAATIASYQLSTTIS